MNTIIAAVDFSKTSINAANYGANLALAVNAKLVLLHVFKMPMTFSELPISGGVFEEMLEISRQDLDDLAARLTLKIKGQISIRTEVLVGTIENQIEEFSGHEDPFAVVMGLKAGSTLERFFLRSNTLFATRHMHHPVLIIPENVVFSPIKKIGLACDLDHVEALPYNQLSEWLSAFNASLDLINVNNSENGKPSEISECLTLQNRLNKFRPKFHLLNSRHVEEKLSEFAKDHDLDLMIIVPKKHNFDELLNAKHTNAIITHQQCPVLAMHSK